MTDSKPKNETFQDRLVLFCVLVGFYGLSIRKAFLYAWWTR